jgi:hypothetical protein
MTKIFEDKLRRIIRKVLREAEEEPNNKQPNQGQKPTDNQHIPQQKEKPKKEENSGLKYDMKYVNGGFNNGVAIEPANGGKLALSISIYGGGEPKKVKLPASPEIAKIIQGYEIAVKNNDKLGLTMEPKLDQYLQGLEQEISLGVIKAMQEFDQKVKQIILNTIKNVSS